MCQHCIDGWGEEISAGIDAFLDEHEAMAFGPGHIVLEDMNCEPHHIDWCCGLIIGELRRRGLPYREPLNDDERRGAVDIERGFPRRAHWEYPNGFYGDYDADELKATDEFMRAWLRPRAVAYQTRT